MPAILLLFPLLIALSACTKQREQPSGSASASQVAFADTLSLGKDNQVTSGKTYAIGDVKLTVVRIAMASGTDEKGREIHQLNMDLRVQAPGAAATELALVGDAAGEAAGLVFRADALGFQWGQSPPTATLRVDRK